MSESNLNPPATTELEVRVREALKVARWRLQYTETLRDDQLAAAAARDAIRDIIRILEDGRS